MGICYAITDHPIRRRYINWLRKTVGTLGVQTCQLRCWLAQKQRLGHFRISGKVNLILSSERSLLLHDNYFGRVLSCTLFARLSIFGGMHDFLFPVTAICIHTSRVIISPSWFSYCSLCPSAPDKSRENKQFSRGSSAYDQPQLFAYINTYDICVSVFD